MPLPFHPRKHAEKAKIVNTVTTRRCLMRTRTQKVMVESQELQEVNSPANKTKKVDEPCWHWAKGKCRYGDKCNKRHDPHLFNTAPNTEASGSKATPALVHEWSDDEGTFHKVASNVVKKKVRFDESKTYVQTYVKKDFVKCSREIPNHLQRSW